MQNTIEDLKKQVDGLDVYEHILEASKAGYGAVNKELIPLFKWYGVYAQKPNEQGYFMMRVKVPGGKLNSSQLRKLHDLAQRYARGVLDITTRQAVQMHWLRIENIPTIINELIEVGLDTAGACGDITRNITGCPLAGLTDEEVLDASPELMAVEKFMNRNKDFSNLPRKYKMSITGCSTWCSQPDINCLSLVGVTHTKTGEKGFTLKVGGGLSTKPIIAKNFPVFIRRDQALDVVKAVSVVYRDNGFRDKRANARIKILVEAWGVEKFLEETEKVLAYKLERIPLLRTMNTGAKEYFPSPKVSHNDHLGITKLNNGKYALGLAFISGRSRDDDFLNIANLMDKYGENAELRTTNKQNAIIVNIPEENLEAIQQESRKLGLKTEHSAFTRLGVACTGTEFCNLAIVETKARAKELFDYLDSKFPDFQDQLMISVTGCPNNCAQYAVADIGLVGCKMKNEAGEMEDAFRIFLGGRLGDEAQFGKALEGRYFHKDIHLVLEKILEDYFSSRLQNEKFTNYLDRVKLKVL